MQVLGCRPGRPGTRGFSLVELLIVIAVIVILIALLLPAVGMMRGKSRQSQCASNQRQIGLAWTGAMSRDPSHPVRATDWVARLTPYLSQGTALLFCPNDVPASAGSSFGLNAHAWRMSAPDAGRIVLLDYHKTAAQIVDQSFAQLDAAWPADQASRHFSMLNVLHHDGHVESREARTIDPRYCVLFERYWRPVKDARITLAGCLTGDPSPAATLPGGASSASTGGSGSATSTTSSGGTTSGSTTGGGGQDCSSFVTKKFDFGPVGSPVEPGYTLVTPAAAYNAGVGYGFTSGTPSALTRSYGSNLQRDIVFGSQVTFRVDVPNGDYTVRLYIGDTDLALHDQQQISINGAVKETVTTQEAQVITRTYNVTAAGGSIIVDLTDMGGSDANVCLAGLEISCGGDSIADPPHTYPNPCQDPNLCAIPNDMVNYFQFDNPGDLGQATIGPAASNNGAVQYSANGVSGGCAHFNGSGHWIQPAGNGMGTHQAGSVCLWISCVSVNYFQTTSACNNYYYAHFLNSTMGDNGGTNNEMCTYGASAAGFFLARNGTECGGCNGSIPGPSVWLTGGSGMLDGYWHHIVNTWDPNGDMVVYLDGCEVGRNNIAFASHLNKKPFYIQRLGRGNEITYGRKYVGYMDNLRLYARQLTACEVAAIYAAKQ